MTTSEIHRSEENLQIENMPQYNSENELTTTRDVKMKDGSKDPKLRSQMRWEYDLKLVVRLM